ncbi:MAG: hypothetical protein Kow00107_11220 [Planctomycetota bacterium]
MNERQFKSILLICDISGYTSFMLTNRMSLRHAQLVISDLMQAVISEVEIPLRISKLEGDALFLFAERPEAPELWEKVRSDVSNKLISFFRVFSRRVDELSKSTMCSCGACANIESLRMKAVMHYGEVLMYELKGFCELSGPDVILVHRMLKNSLEFTEYILATKTAVDELRLALPNSKEINEIVPDFGKVRMLYSLPPFDNTEEPPFNPGLLDRIVFNALFMLKAVRHMIGRTRVRFRHLQEPEETERM